MCAVAAATVLTACSSPSKTDKQSYAVNKKITSLRVDNYAGSIEVVAATGDTVKVVEEYDYSDGRPQTEHSVTGGQLLLKSSGCGSDADKCAVRYHVEVPATTAAHLTLGGGDITVHGLSGATYAKSEGGSVDIGDSSAKSVTAANGGGDVSVSFKSVPDKVDASTEGGDATVHLPQGTYAVDATTEGGHRSVDVKTDSGSAHKVRAHTEGGDVNVESTG
ncbi:DUF4097 family beta strand repeat-containing protein [Streptomyces sp. NPDC058964]|uniref:DUF4097 family beta strand repeat-containing protein n=1 Tax=Streptomyces sp. NPDC058964 TaxID=3346681 RepID=UPI0036C32199